MWAAKVLILLTLFCEIWSVPTPASQHGYLESPTVHGIVDFSLHAYSSIVASSAMNLHPSAYSKLIVCNLYV